MAVELPSSESELHSLLAKAVSSRSSHIRKESETMTLVNVRRLLETDLGLEKCALDPHKSTIRKLVDEVLLNSDNAEDQEGGEADNSEEETVPGPEPDQKLKEVSSQEGPKKVSRKKPRQENGSPNQSGSSQNEDLHTEAPKKKKLKKEKVVVNDSDEELSAGSEEKPKKVSKVTPVKSTQDKRIEHLKKTIKACGLGIPPAIYKRAKQLPSEKYNSCLAKELEGILSRHGLSSDPTEKEIKAAKRKIARDKDMEGIDMTNIITEPRGRRAASQFFSPVYKPPTVDHYSEEDEKSDSEDENSGSEEDEKVGSEDDEKVGSEEDEKADSKEDDKADTEDKESPAMEDKESPDMEDKEKVKIEDKEKVKIEDKEKVKIEDKGKLDDKKADASCGDDAKKTAKSESCD